jgi:uncharacterized membrane protein
VALRRSLPAAGLGVAVLAIVALSPPVDFLDRDVPADLRLYESFGERMVAGEIPYRDFYVDYPPGSVPAFFVPALADGFPTAFRLEMFALAGVCVALVAVVLARTGAGTLRLYAAPLAAALAALPLRQVFFDRYDLWPTALLVAGLAAFVLGRPGTGGAALGVGAAAKIFPLVALPLVLVRRSRHEAVVGLLVAGAVVTLPFAALGPGGVRFTMLQQVKRPIQIETLGGSLLLVADRLGLTDVGVVLSYGSHNIAGRIGSTVAAVQLVLLVAALVAVWLLHARGPRNDGRLLTAVAASTVAFVVFGKVLSPQYLIWLAPIVPLAASSVWLPAVGTFFGAAVLTQLWFPSRFGELVREGDVAWIVAGRNLVLVALFVALLVGLRPSRPGTPAPRAPG